MRVRVLRVARAVSPCLRRKLGRLLGERVMCCCGLCSFGVWVEWCKGQGVEKSQASVWTTSKLTSNDKVPVVAVEYT